MRSSRIVNSQPQLGDLNTTKTVNFNYIIFSSLKSFSCYTYLIISIRFIIIDLTSWFQYLTLGLEEHSAIVTEKVRK